ncbi:Inositol polyphosphate-related phosphatase domain-containing protein [Pleurotus pulmonarius]
MSEILNEVRALLLPADDAQAVLEVLVTDEEKPSNPGSSDQPRLLAVISHIRSGSSQAGQHEEGSIFLLRRSPSERLEIQRVFPIFRDLSLNLAQSRRATLDLSATAKPVSNQPRTGFVLTLQPGSQIPPLVLTAFDTHNLRPLLSECKRLQELALTHSTDQGASYPWLLPYTLRKNTQPIMSQTPIDLRVLNKPLHEQLSPASAGLPGDDAADSTLIRDHWVRKQARDVCHKGTYRLTLRVGTFNVNGKPPLDDLAVWTRGPESFASKLPPLENLSPLSIGLSERPPSDLRRALSSNASSLDRDPDIFVFGFQELDLSTEALLYSTSTIKEDSWTSAIFASLGDKASQYTKLASKQLVGMLIIIIIKVDLKPCFSDVRLSATGAGIMGVMGNKGGTAVRLAFTPPTQDNESSGAFRPTVLTFVNTHLAAFDEMVDKRNMDFHDLSKRLGFSSYAPVEAINPPQTSIYESDVLIWMGGKDLNYRIDLPDGEVRSILRTWPEDTRYTTLLRYDQLRNAIAGQRAFDLFKEFPINHLPSYRYGSGMTDELGYDLKRRPAWTDRILHLSSPSVHVRQLNYQVHPTVTLSDHRPVSAEFIVPVDILPGHEYYESLRRLLRQVAPPSLQEEVRPMIAVEDTSIHFGQIRYKQLASRTIRVKNTGEVPCCWRFIPIAPNETISPEWLRILPLNGLLLPSEVALITLEINIGPKEAPTLNLGSKVLGAALILHTAFGKDHFISVGAEYQYSCFANDLIRLTHLPGPVRSLKSQDDLLPENRGVNAPREIMRLVNWLMKSADISKLLDSSSDPQVVAQLREHLDTGTDFPYPVGDVDPAISRAFWDTLWELIMSLTEPIVPFTLQARCTQMTSRDEAFEFLSELTPAAVNVWISVTAFLQFLCQADSSEETARRVATMCFPALLPDDPNPQSTPISPLAKVNFILYFIT